MSVVHRSGRPTAADYGEAIAALVAARGQLEPDGRGCVVCGDSGHQAFDCHHNPLLLARRFAAAVNVWVCFHCGVTCTTEVEAREHFGPENTPTPVCAGAMARVVAAARRLAEEAGETVKGGVVGVDDLRALNVELDALDTALGRPGEGAGA